MWVFFLSKYELPKKSYLKKQTISVVYPLDYYRGQTIWPIVSEGKTLSTLDDELVHVTTDLTKKNSTTGPINRGLVTEFH